MNSYNLYCFTGCYPKNYILESDNNLKDLTEEELTCPECGKIMKVLGQNPSIGLGTFACKTPDEKKQFFKDRNKQRKNKPFKK